MMPQDIILKPLLSEKSYAGVTSKKYIFVVGKNANKTQIKDAVEKMFDGVKVEKVNTANCIGKMKRQGKTQGMTSSFKKAYIILKPESKAIAQFDSLS